MNASAVAVAEYHLFILWEQARGEEARILADLARRFSVVRVREVRWSAEKVAENFTRFYGQKLPPGSFKEVHCGGGAFLAVLVRDERPLYEMRETSQGERPVNIRTFDAKQIYREWTGGGHRVHATDSEAETRHNVALLFGQSLAELGASAGAWEGEIEPWRADLAGARGWENLSQLFALLNEATRYLVLRNFDALPAQFTTAAHGDIDLLVDSAEDVAFLANARKIFPEPHRIHYGVPMAGEEVLFDFRFVGDDYYARDWEEAMLAARQWCPRGPGGFYTPGEEDHFYGLLYHALVHKRQVAPDYVEKLGALAAEMGLPTITPAFFAPGGGAKRALDLFLGARGYGIVRPQDASVFFHETLLLAERPPFIQRGALRKLPSTRPLSALLSARRLGLHEGRPYFSTVYEGEEPGTIYKQATANLAWRDAELLRRVPGPHFPRVLEAGQEEGWSWAIFERLDGTELANCIPQVASSPRRLAAFFAEALEIIAALQTAGLVHRDVHARNLLVSERGVALIDFGWAVAADRQTFTLDGLGGDHRPPEGRFCDVYALGKTFAQCVPVQNALFAPLLAAMTHPDPAQRVVSPTALQALLAQIKLPESWAEPPLFQAEELLCVRPPWHEDELPIYERARTARRSKDLAGAREILLVGLLCQPASELLRISLADIERRIVEAAKPKPPKKTKPPRLKRSQRLARRLQGCLAALTPWRKIYS